MNISNEAIAALKEQVSATELEKKTIRFFGVQGCCGPSVQMALEDQKHQSDESFTKDGVQFSFDPSIKEMLEPVTLVFTEQGFQLQGFQSSGCC